MPLTPEMVDIAACPFCGSVDINDGEVLTEHPSGKVTTQSMCNGCGALGPEADTGNVPDHGSVKARAAWNARAQSQRAMVVEDIKRLITSWDDEKWRRAENGDYATGIEMCINELRALIERAGGGA